MFCKACCHIKKDLSLAAGYYHRQSGRSKLLEMSVAIKNGERAAFIKRFLKKGQKILELGCAEGSLGELIRRSFSVSYYGLEPSEDAKTAKLKLNGLWNSAQAIPGNFKFDLILGFHVLEHICVVEKIVPELCRLLKDDGRLVFEVPCHSGNDRVPWDFNKEHAHLFSAASLACLFENRGFEIESLTTGHYESAVYSNSIRIVARKKRASQRQKADLSQRIKRLLGRRYVVYGVGGDFRGLVSPYLVRADVRAVMDGSRGNIGKSVMGKRIEGPEAIGSYTDSKFLVATYRYQSEILEVLASRGVHKSRIVTLEDILK